MEDLGAIVMADVIDLLRRFARAEADLPEGDDRLHPQVRPPRRERRPMYRLSKIFISDIAAGARRTWLIDRQVNFARTEGGIKDTFKFRSEAEFLGFFLGCVADMDAAVTLRETIDTSLRKMADRPRKKRQLRAARDLKGRISDFDAIARKWREAREAADAWRTRIGEAAHLLAGAARTAARGRTGAELTPLRRKVDGLAAQYHIRLDADRNRVQEEIADLEERRKAAGTARIETEARLKDLSGRFNETDAGLKAAERLDGEIASLQGRSDDIQRRAAVLEEERRAETSRWKRLQTDLSGRESDLKAARERMTLKSELDRLARTRTLTVDDGIQDLIDHYLGQGLTAGELKAFPEYLAALHDDPAEIALFIERDPGRFTGIIAADESVIGKVLALPVPEGLHRPVVISSPCPIEEAAGIDHAVIRPTDPTVYSTRHMEGLKGDDTGRNYEPVGKDLGSGGEALTTAVLLYALLISMRKKRRNQPDGKIPAFLVLDNPLGVCNRSDFLDAQLKVARAMGIQCVYLTGINDRESLDLFDLRVAIRKSDRQVTIDGQTLHLLEVAELNVERKDG